MTLRSRSRSSLLFFLSLSRALWAVRCALWGTAAPDKIFLLRERGFYHFHTFSSLFRRRARANKRTSTEEAERKEEERRRRGIISRERDREREREKGKESEREKMTDTWQLSAVASLVEDIDKKILVVLRDNSNIVGTLRSFDQFANIVLENAVERMIVGTHYSDVPLGLYIVRGENVVLMGDIDEAIELKGLTWVENDEIRRMKDAEMEADKMHGLIARNLDMLLDD